MHTYDINVLACMTHITYTFPGLMQIHVTYTQQNKTLIIGNHNVCMDVTPAYVSCKALYCILRAIAGTGETFHSIYLFFYVVYVWSHPIIFWKGVFSSILLLILCTGCIVRNIPRIHRMGYIYIQHA